MTITCTGNGSAVLWHPSDSAPATVLTVPNIIVQLGMLIFDVSLVLISHNNNAVASIATVTNVRMSSASIQDSGMTFMTLDVTVSGMYICTHSLREIGSFLTPPQYLAATDAATTTPLSSIHV